VILETRGRSGFNRFAVGLVLLWAAFGTTSPALAQSTIGRKFRSADIRREDEGWNIELRFHVPMRVLGQQPESPGRTLRISVEPVDLGGEPERPVPREVMPLPASGRGPIRRIVYDASLRAAPVVEIGFDETLRFEVTQGSDFRSLLVRARPAHERTPERPAPEPESPRTEGPSGRLLGDARRALRDGENDRAIALLTRVLELPASPANASTRMEARELLGITRERLGQSAHARAEYETYLEEYPDGPGAKRVAQRLDALLTAASDPRAPLRQIEVEEEVRRAEVFGSLAARYYRSDIVVLDDAPDLLQSDLLTDMSLTGRLDDDDWRLEGDFVGTYDRDLGDQDRSDDLRVYTLAIDFEDRLHGVEATLGRQRRSDSGVLGRFDGLRVATRFASRFEAAVLGGFAIDGLRDQSLQTDTVLGGGSIEGHDLWLEGFDAQLYVLGREASGMTDRVALGGELRYIRGRSYTLLYLDYDALYDSLNTFMLTSTLPVGEDLDLRTLFERRNTPVLTLSNALQGQQVDDLDDLEDLFSESEIRDLAEDRTSVLWSGMAGFTHRTTERWQLAGDVTVSYFEGTDSSADVPGSDSTGPDLNATLQATLADWLIENGVANLVARYYEGDESRALGLAGIGHIPLTTDLRLRPRFRWEWRDSSFAGHRSRLRPSVELEWRPLDFTIDTEAGLDWSEPIAGSDVEQELGYWFEVGARWDF